MGRGPKPIPDAVKALRGNPGRRRLQLVGQAGPAVSPRPLATFEIPDWLTGLRERAIFRQVVEDYLQRRIIRAPDFMVAARWASYLDLWITAKQAGELSKLETLEKLIRPLDDRLGLSPLARQDILRGLASMPAAIGDMLAEDQQSGGGSVSPVGEADDVPTAGDLPSSAAMSTVSPLGFLKPN